MLEASLYTSACHTSRLERDTSAVEVTIHRCSVLRLLCLRLADPNKAINDSTFATVVGLVAQIVSAFENTYLNMYMSNKLILPDSQ
jgi:hypothetical protein